MSYLLTLIFAVHMHLYKIYVILSLKCCPCNGKEKENWYPEESKLNLYRVEYLGVANNCNRVIPFTAKTSTCRNCQSTFGHTKFKNNALKINNITQNLSGNHPTEAVKGENVEKDENEIVLTKQNAEEMKEVLAKVLPEAPSEMLDLLVNQKQNLQRNPNGRRWDKK